MFIPTKQTKATYLKIFHDPSLGPFHANIWLLLRELSDNDFFVEISDEELTKKFNLRFKDCNENQFAKFSMYDLLLQGGEN